MAEKKNSLGLIFYICSLLVLILVLSDVKSPNAASYLRSFIENATEICTIVGGECVEPTHCQTIVSGPGYGKAHLACNQTLVCCYELVDHFKHSTYDRLVNQTVYEFYSKRQAHKIHHKTRKQGLVHALSYKASNRSALCELINGTCTEPMSCELLNNYKHVLGKDKKALETFACNISTICCYGTPLSHLTPLHGPKPLSQAKVSHSPRRSSVPHLYGNTRVAPRLHNPRFQVNWRKQKRDPILIEPIGAIVGKESFFRPDRKRRAVVNSNKVISYTLMNLVESYRRLANLKRLMRLTAITSLRNRAKSGLSYANNPLHLRRTLQRMRMRQLKKNLVARNKAFLIQMRRQRQQQLLQQERIARVQDWMSVYNSVAGLQPSDPRVSPVKNDITDRRTETLLRQSQMLNTAGGQANRPDLDYLLDGMSVTDNPFNRESDSMPELLQGNEDLSLPPLHRLVAMLADTSPGSPDDLLNQIQVLHAARLNREEKENDLAKMLEHLSQVETEQRNENKGSGGIGEFGFPPSLSTGSRMELAVPLQGIGGNSLMDRTGPMSAARLSQTPRSDLERLAELFAQHPLREKIHDQTKSESHAVIEQNMPQLTSLNNRNAGSSKPQIKQASVTASLQSAENIPESNIRKSRAQDTTTGHRSRAEMEVVKTELVRIKNANKITEKTDQAQFNTMLSSKMTTPATNRDTLRPLSRLPPFPKSARDIDTLDIDEEDFQEAVLYHITTGSDSFMDDLQVKNILETALANDVKKRVPFKTPHNTKQPNIETENLRNTIDVTSTTTRQTPSLTQLLATGNHTQATTSSSSRAKKQINNTRLAGRLGDGPTQDNNTQPVVNSTIDSIINNGGMVIDDPERDAHITPSRVPMPAAAEPLVRPLAGHTVSQNKSRTFSRVLTSPLRRELKAGLRPWGSRPFLRRQVVLRHKGRGTKRIVGRTFTRIPVMKNSPQVGKSGGFHYQAGYGNHGYSSDYAHEDFDHHNLLNPDFHHYGHDHESHKIQKKGVPSFIVSNFTELCILKSGQCMNPGLCSTDDINSPTRFACNMTTICCLPQAKNTAYNVKNALGKKLFGAVRFDEITDRAAYCELKGGSCEISGICNSKPDDYHDTHDTYEHNHPHHNFYCNLTHTCCLPEKFEVAYVQETIHGGHPETDLYHFDEE